MLKAGVSQKDLAISTNIERSTLTKILNGTTCNPRLDTIYTLAKYFKVDVQELIESSHEPDLKIVIEQNKQVKDVLLALMKISDIANVSLLSKYTGIAISVLSEILNGNTLHPNIKTLQQLSTFFNITIPQLCGIEPVLGYQTAEVVTNNQMIPIIPLSNSDEWISGVFKKVNMYTPSTRKIAGKHSYAIKVEDDKFFPDFAGGHLLIIDNEATPAKNDFIVCKINDQTSIYECADLSKTSTITLKEAGKFDYIEVNRNQVNILGVVVQQALNG